MKKETKEFLSNSTILVLMAANVAAALYFVWEMLCTK